MKPHAVPEDREPTNREVLDAVHQFHSCYEADAARSGERLDDIDRRMSALLEAQLAEREATIKDVSEERHRAKGVEQIILGLAEKTDKQLFAFAKGTRQRFDAVFKRMDDDAESGREWRQVALAHMNATNAALGVKVPGAPEPPSKPGFRFADITTAGKIGMGVGAFLVALAGYLATGWPKVHATLQALGLT